MARNAWKILARNLFATARPAAQFGATHLRPLKFSVTPLLPSYSAKTHSTLTPAKFYDNEKSFSLSAANVRDQFLEAKKDLLEEFEEELSSHEIDRHSIEVGHKIVAFRTILSRVWLDLESEYNDPLTRQKAEISEKELAEKIAQNKIYIRFTMHPTEGQNLPTILGKDVIIKITNMISKIKLLEIDGGKSLSAKDRNNMLAKLMLDLIEVAKTSHIENEFVNFITKNPEFSIKSENLLHAAKEIRKGLIREFVTKPIHHTEKMTMTTEQQILLHHLSRCRKESAKIATDHPEIVTMDHMKFSTWGSDLDGKPHVKPGHGVALEYEGQKTFFTDLLVMLESFKTYLDLRELDSEEFFEKIITPILEISKSDHLFLAEERKDNDRKISEILESFAKSNEIGKEDSFVRIQKYAAGTGCRVAENMSTTREEVDKTTKAFDEITIICGLDSSSSIFDLLERTNDPTIITTFAKTLAENFSRLSKESQRQVMFQMESAVIHEKHEHIISQFDCNLESYRKTLALFEICKHLPQHHEKVSYFREYYEAAGKAAGFNLYDQLFSSQAIAVAATSMVELSPLAEDKTTIPLLVDFTRDLLADKQITDYIARSGGVIRQTRSNSDGSSSLGPQRVSYEYLKADIAIKKMAQEAGFRLEILSGIGANDIERMAPWTIDLLHSQFTAQGGDAQCQTENRIKRMLTKNPENESEKLLVELEAKYGEDTVKSLSNFYYRNHCESEEGFDVKVGGKTAKSGHMTSRGTIAGKAVSHLGKLSSRPDSRTGDVGSDLVPSNDFDVWHDSVYNPQMRRIGAISLQRVSGVATFLTAPFAHISEGFDPSLVADFNKIPAIRNTNFSAIFALGTADVESFLLSNGLPVVSSEAVEEYAQRYSEFLRVNKEESPAIVEEYAKEHSFDSPGGIRAGHLSMQIHNLRFVLRNAITPLAHNCSEETRAGLEEIFSESEAGCAIREYNKLVTKTCNILVKDKSIDSESKEVLVCIAQQILNVRKENHYYDTRKKLIMGAHESLCKEDLTGFDEACKDLAIITRSAGNPLSPGRKTHEMLSYFRDSFGTLAIDIAHEKEPVLMERAALEDLSRC